MKYVFLLVIVCWCGTVKANRPPDSKKRLDFKPGHDFYLGAGNTPLPANDEEEDLDLNNRPPIHFEGDTYRGGKYTPGAYFVGYAYRMKRWLSIGMSTSYTAYYRNFYEYYTDRKVGREHSRYWGIVPAVRFSWLNGKWVSMYSGLGWGVTFKWSKSSRPEDTYKKFKCIDTPEVTLLGIAVGRTWFVFAEGGVTDHGAFCMGIGYRLNSKRCKR